METKSWWTSKTIWTALAAIVAAWAAYFTDGAELGLAVQATVAGLLAIFLRKGQGVAIGAVLLMVCMAGCSTVDSMKHVEFEAGSITLNSYPYKVVETQLENGEVAYQMIMPDGTYQDVKGMPYMGNLTLIVNLNDGTSQTSRGQVDAEVSPTVTGQGEASSTDTDSGVMTMPEAPVVTEETVEPGE